MTKIFIIGPARSGTTLLGNIFKSFEFVHYEEEPSIVWRYGNAKNIDDKLTCHNANKIARRTIPSYFERKLIKNGKNILVEKTPANCLRIDFLRELFPDAHFIFLFRKPEDILKSALLKWKGNVDRNYVYVNKGVSRFKLLVRIRKIFTIRISEFVYYIPTIKNAILVSLGIRKVKVWGPVIPGMYQLAEHYSVPEVAAMQVRYCLNEMEMYLSTSKDDKVIVVTYEELLVNPKRVFFNITKQIGLKINENTFPSKLVKSKKTNLQETHLAKCGIDLDEYKKALKLL